MKAAGRVLLVLGIKRFRGGRKVSATAAGSAVPLSVRDVLRRSGCKRLWRGQVVSILGDFLAVFGVINLITFKWHGTPLQVTNVMIAFIIPMAIVGPLAGVFVDRWNVKRTMIISDLIRAALILGLVFVTRMEQIYVLFFLVSTVSSFFGPSQSVTLRTLVPVNGLMSANALMSQAFYTMRIIAPAGRVCWCTGLGTIRASIWTAPAFSSLLRCSRRSQSCAW